MKTVYLITTNPGKVQEIAEHLKKFGIEVVAKDIEIPELRSDDQEEVAKEKAKLAAKAIGEPAIAEDTGLYFEAYHNFPGTNSKWVYHAIGLEGLFKLLVGTDRGAYFKTTVGFCEPGKEPKIFIGICKGKIIEEARGTPHPRLPYDAIFVPDGNEKTFAEMTTEEKNRFSHRAKAVESFAKWFITS